MRHSPTLNVAIFLIVLLLFLNPVLAQSQQREWQVYELEELVVQAERMILPTKEASETVYTGYELTKEGLGLKGEASSTNVWSQISVLPGVLFQSPDPGNFMRGSVTVRGVGGHLGTMAIEGVPVYGGNPIGPRSYVVDGENFESIALYKGAIPTELGAGVGTRGGVMSLRPQWAQEEAQLFFKQAYGGNDFHKTFLRVDSGKIGDFGTRFSLSGSYAEEDKWKGEGKAGPRKNLNFTLVQPVSEKVTFKLWGNFNDVTWHNYRSLSYQQAMDPERYYRWDYNEKLTGNPNDDWQYYKFFKTSWENKDLFGFLDLKPLSWFKLEVKPYWREEEKEEWSGSSRISGPKGSRPGIQISSWTVERQGVIVQGIAEYRGVKVLLGYHHEESEWKDSVGKNFWLNPDGSLGFVGWGRFTKSTGPTVTKSPYGTLSGKVGRFSWQVGLKYFDMEEPRSEGYVTKYRPDGTPYLEREPRMDYGSTRYTVWAPSLGLSYSLSEAVEPYLSLGRTFQRPYAYMPIINLYYRLYDKFTKLGITLSDLFKEYDCEKTDNLDIGLRVKTKSFDLFPVLYFQRHKNLLTPITPGWRDPDNPSQPLIDPSTQSPVSYSTNVGKAKGWGFELGSSFRLAEGVMVFFNPAYIKLTYDGDVVSQGVRYPVDGKQVVNVPEWVLTGGVQFRYKGFQLTPTVRYVSSCYGDLARAEKIPPYALWDLSLSYSIERLGRAKDVRVSLDMYNLFDKRYVIPGYYYGPPFMAIGSIQLKF